MSGHSTKQELSTSFLVHSKKPSIEWLFFIQPCGNRDSCCICSIPSAGPAHQLSPLHGPAQLGQASPQPVSDTRTPDAGARHRRINESLLALALVDPTQYTTQLASRPETCPAI